MVSQEGVKLFVGGIPTPHATEEQLAELFETHGAWCHEVVILPPKGSNPDTRCGFVRVNEAMADNVCMALNGMTFEGYGEKLVVRVANNPGQKMQPGAGVGPPTPVTVRPPNRNPGPPSVVAPGGANYANGGHTNHRNALQDLGEGIATPTSSKEAAKAEGRWVDAAQCLEEEYVASGENFVQKIQRLSEELQQAAVQEHFYEAHALYESLSQLDPQAAAVANAQAAAACAGRASAVPAVVKPPVRDVVAPPVRDVVPPPVRVVQPPPRRPVEPPFAPPMLAAPRAAHVVSPPPHAPGWAQQGQQHVRSGRVHHEQPSCSGTIIAFHPDRHFGFIQSADLGADAFLSDKQIGSFKVGDFVFFDVTYNAQGKPQAQNLQPASSGMFMDGPPGKRLRY